MKRHRIKIRTTVHEATIELDELLPLLERGFKILSIGWADEEAEEFLKE